VVLSLAPHAAPEINSGEIRNLHDQCQGEENETTAS